MNQQAKVRAWVPEPESGSYRKPLAYPDLAVKRTQRVEAGLCINAPPKGGPSLRGLVHGPQWTDPLAPLGRRGRQSVRCHWCALVHRHGAAKARELWLTEATEEERNTFGPLAMVDPKTGQKL